MLRIYEGLGWKVWKELHFYLRRSKGDLLI